MTTPKERTIAVSASAVVQSLFALMISIIWALSARQFTRLENQVTEIQTNLIQLELGIRGDRFSRSDWFREREILLAGILERQKLELESLERQIQELKAER